MTFISSVKSSITINVLIYTDVMKYVLIHVRIAQQYMIAPMSVAVSQLENSLASSADNNLLQPKLVLQESFKALKEQHELEEYLLLLLYILASSLSSLVYCRDPNCETLSVYFIYIIKLYIRIYSRIKRSTKVKTYMYLNVSGLRGSIISINYLSDNKNKKRYK